MICHICWIKAGNVKENSLFNLRAHYKINTTHSVLMKILSRRMYIRRMYGSTHSLLLKPYALHQKCVVMLLLNVHISVLSSHVGLKYFLMRYLTYCFVSFSIFWTTQSKALHWFRPVFLIRRIEMNDGLLKTVILYKQIRHKYTDMVSIALTNAIENTVIPGKSPIKLQLFDDFFFVNWRYKLYQLDCIIDKAWDIPCNRIVNL